MTRWLASLALALGCAAGARAETNAFWFPVGEEMIYEIHWGYIHVGQTHITTAWTNEQGRPLIAIRYFTKTSSLVATLYPVELTMETLIDPETFLPVRNLKKGREGKQRSDEFTVFDYAAGEARFENLLKKKTKTFPIDADTRDIITMMYWLRRTPFVLGDERDYRVMADDKVYDLGIRVTKEEPVKLDRYGKLDCHRIDPEAAFDGLFIRKGRITFWVSQDERRVCTKMEGEVAVASIWVRLAEVRGPGEDFWVKPKDDKK